MGKNTKIKIKPSLQGSTIDVNVEALGKKSNLFSKCKLMLGLKKCPQKSPIVLGCNKIE
jgi:hypothetical protein